MTGLRLPALVRRFGYAALGVVAPEFTGRRATDVFSTTRALGVYPDDVIPLGAHRFEVHGDPDVREGFLWGEEGPVALLVHGWGTDSSSMHGLIPSLRALGYRVAAFDAPAHGASRGSQATMTQFTLSVGAVLDTLGDVRVIVAHSLGSIAAVGAAAERPAMPIDCVALVAPTCTLTGVLERWSGGELRLRRATVERIYQELHRRNGVPVSHWDVVGLGRDLRRPVLAIHDPGDDVVPFSEAEAIAAGLGDVRLEPAPGHGHIRILMAPAVREMIADFVSRQASTDERAIG